jgi:hypothetical protein
VGKKKVNTEATLGVAAVATMNVNHAAHTRCPKRVSMYVCVLPREQRAGRAWLVGTPEFYSTFTVFAQRDFDDVIDTFCELPFATKIHHICKEPQKRTTRGVYHLLL